MEKTWIRVGAFAGLAGTLAYFVVILVPAPLTTQVLLVTVRGVCISMGAPGLYYLLALNQKTVTLQIGVAASAVAGVVMGGTHVNAKCGTRVRGDQWHPCTAAKTPSALTQ